MGVVDFLKLLDGDALILAMMSWLLATTLNEDCFSGRSCSESPHLDVSSSYSDGGGCCCDSTFYCKLTTNYCLWLVGEGRFDCTI